MCKSSKTQLAAVTKVFGGRMAPGLGKTDPNGVWTTPDIQPSIQNTILHKNKCLHNFFHTFSFIFLSFLGFQPWTEFSVGVS